jgi:RNA polymerase sigma factor for flagellar operon FliA
MRAHCVSVQRQNAETLDAKDRAVVENLSLVRAIAVRVHDNLPVHVDLEDLIHAGVIGLIDAVRKFDDAKNVAFQSYAKHRVRGAILDSLRQLDWASRDLRKRQKQADAATRELSANLGRMPYEHEVAAKMGIGLDRWRKTSMDLRTMGSAPGPVRETGDERNSAEETPAAPDLRPDRLCEQTELRNTLAKAIEKLPARYQRVVKLYYTNDMTMKEIGDVLGVNESRVSQIHKTALRKMATTLGERGICSASAL